MNLWEKIMGGFGKDAKVLSYVELPEKVAVTAKIEPDRHYFRIWMKQMHVKTAQKWFIDRHPAVNAQVSVKFGGYEKMTFARVIAPSQDKFKDGVFANYPLTELMPYRGGVVELTAGLMALPGDNGWKTAVQMLEKFSGLVTPPLGQTLGIAQQVSTAVGDFLGQVDVAPHLGLHTAFTTGTGFSPGYIAVILAAAGTYGKDDLELKGEALHVKATGRPLEAHDFMLLRVEAVDGRDDVLLKNIEEPFREACDAEVRSDRRKGEMCEQAAKAAALSSADLTWPDRRRAVELVMKRLAEIREFGFNAKEKRPENAGDWHNHLHEYARQETPSVSEAVKRGEMGFAEAMGA